MQVNLSVRDLAQFVHASGDLGSISFDEERAQLGALIHRQIQKNYPKDACEIFLKRSDTLEDITFQIEGRADLLYHQDEYTIIEELKTTAVPLEKLEAQDVHKAQVLLYGAMYGKDHDLSEIKIILKYIHIENYEEKSFTEVWSIEQLEAFYLDTLRQYVFWAKKEADLRQRAIQSARTLTFPYTQYRPTQKQLCAAVYRSIQNREQLFIQASTGIGKTISTLFPALKCIGEETIEKIFYLCAKNITANTALSTMEQILTQVPFKVIPITAKDRICFLEERNCDPEVCPYAKGYYQRNKDAMRELLEEHNLISREVIEETARKHAVCPFELSLDTLLYCDVIICDYNYAFDPKVYLKRCFDMPNRYALLVDEAHNLVDRSLSMYSAQLSLSQLTQIQKLKIEDTSCKRALSALTNAFHALIQEEAELIAKPDLDPFLVEKCLNLQKALQVYLRKEEKEIDKDLQSFYFALCDFIRIFDYYDENYCTIEETTDNDLIIKQFCMNARNPLKKIYQSIHNVTFFSATISPLRYYQNMLGCEKADPAYDFPSIFPRENTLVLIHRNLSTRYKDREATLQESVESIYASILGKAGNYLVFAPSYAYLEALHALFTQLYPDFETIIQQSEFNEQDKQAFLSRFETSDKHLIGFAVLGGMFAEGIDFLGDKLIGAIIVSVGLAGISKEKELVKAHFNAQKEDGFAYAYSYPGMNKVLQAAGRVIRSPEDRGVLVFLDERFATRFYQQLFPVHYRHAHFVRTAGEILTLTSQFFQDKSAAH